MTGILSAHQGAFGRVVFFDITRPIGDHAHPHIHLLFKVSGSDRGMQVGAEQVRLGGDNCVLVNPWQRHADIDALCTSATQMLAFYIDRGWFRERIGALAGPVFAGTQCRLGTTARQRLDELCERMAGGEPVESQSIERIIAEVVAVAAGSVRTALPDRGSGDFRIRRAIETLKSQIQVSPDFSELARSVGLSRSRFFEQFKNSVGIAPNMYVDGLLIERAIELLLQSDIPIDDISEELGFSAQSSFSRFFKERVGFPPSTLRQAAA